MRHWQLTIALGLFASFGCSESCSCLIVRPPSTQVRREIVHEAASKAHLASRSAPHPAHPGKGIFGDQIEYLGYDVDPAIPRAGGPVAVTFYYHALKDVARDWEIFVHIDDRGGRSERINGDHWPVENEFHTDQWKQGDYIADRFAFVVPAYQANSALELWSGFYEGEERLPISNPKDCQNDGNNRLLAGTLALP
ncbi:MAG: hypothetical protein ACYCWW_04245 [Deltaproteobacteria bacterium]